MRLLLLFLFLPIFLAAQPVVYKDAQTLLTGTWAGASSTLTEVTGETPFEGTKHYKFDYTISNWWAGLGLNMDNWNSGAPRDFSGYSHIRIAYRGLSGGQVLRVQLRNNGAYSNSVDIGGANGTYGVVDVPIITLLAGSSFAINTVREVDLSVGGVQTGSGTVYFDAIELVNVSGGGTGSPASAATWGRAGSMSLGLNTANWLEAYWLMPFGTYPETNKFTRTKVRDLRNMGFQSFRLPVTFERIAGGAPNYTLDFNQQALRLVDSMILWANLYDFNLIIDNHHGMDLTNSNYTTELPRLKIIWDQIADHYGYLDPARFFFEIYNEPTPSISNANWRTVATALVAEIRAHEGGTPHSVFVGANSWNAGDQLVAFTPLDDPDIIYTFHNYDPYYFTHQGMSWTSPSYFPARTFPQAGEVAAINNLMAAISDWSDNYNVPVSLGEFGCSSAADAQSRCNWISTMMSAINANGFSYFYWDAISASDGFGFFTNGIIDQAHVVPCFASAMGLSTALPIALEEFRVNCQEKEVHLSWSAHTQGQGYQFEIQHSTDGQKWDNIATVQAKEELRHYEFHDTDVRAFYRLRLIEPDGKVTYSPIRQIDCGNKAVVKIFPNPVQDRLQVRLTSDKLDLASLALYDAHGSVVTQSNYSPAAAIRETTLSVAGIPAGTYWLVGRLSDGSWWKETVVRM